MNIRISLSGVTPLLMHNSRLADPDFEISREIASLTSKTKKTADDRAQIAKLEWYGGLYVDDGLIVYPTANVRKCLIEAARTSRHGKHVERAIRFTAVHVPVHHDGPRDIDALFKDARFRNRLSVGVKKSRVMRTRPQFPVWSLIADGIFIEDAGLDLADLERIVTLAGSVEGLGDNRVNGYGRFEGTAEVL